VERIFAAEFWLGQEGNMTIVDGDVVDIIY
jgi:hypothetical protein